MTEVEIIEEAELEETPPLPAPVVQTTLFGTDDPAEVVERASRVATALADVISKQNLASIISGRPHVRVEGWTLLGSMMGVFPVCAWTRPLTDESGFVYGWEAKYEARTRNGDLVGSAEAMCDRSESNWRNRDNHALRSMAQTRATSKALRLPLGFVMQIAGYDPTPAEEMVAVKQQAAAPAPPVEEEPAPKRKSRAKPLTEETYEKLRSVCEIAQTLDPNWSLKNVFATFKNDRENFPQYAGVTRWSEISEKDGTAALRAAEKIVEEGLATDDDQA